MFTLAQAKHEIENGFFPDVNPESDKFEELLRLLDGEEKSAFTQWVYEHCGKCYVGTRRVAGLRLADQRPDDFMRISGQLIKSSNP